MTSKNTELNINELKLEAHRLFEQYFKKAETFLK